MRCAAALAPASLARPVPRLAVRVPAPMRCALVVKAARAKGPGRPGGDDASPPPPPPPEQPKLAPKPQRPQPSAPARAAADEAWAKPRAKCPRQRQQPGGASLIPAIKAAPSCDAVLALVDQRCSIAELTTAVNRLVRLRRQRGSSEQLATYQAAYARLAELSLQRLAELDCYACAQLFYAAAALQAPLSQKQQAAWEARAVQLLPEGNAQDVSNILWAFGTLQQLYSLQPGSSMLAALEEQLPRALLDGTAAPQAVANSLWAWAKLGQQLSHQVAAAAAATILRTAASMKEQDVANILWAYASSGWQLSSEAAASLAEQLPRVLLDARAAAQAVANSLWAWSKVGLPLSRQAAAAASAGIQRTAASMNAQAVANTLWAFANGGWQLRSEAAATLQEQLPRVLQDGNRQAVANSLWAWSKLELPVDDEMRAAASAAVLRIAPANDPQAVTQVSWAHTKGGWQLSAEALAAAAVREEELKKSGQWN